MVPNYALHSDGGGGGIGDVMMRYPSSLVSLHLSDNKLARYSAKTPKKNWFLTACMLKSIGDKRVHLYPVTFGDFKVIFSPVYISAFWDKNRSDLSSA